MINLSTELLRYLPILSHAYYKYVQLHRELVDGEYQKYEEPDKSGGNINNLLIGYSISAEYFLSKNVALEIGALKDIGNTFYNAPNTNTLNSNIDDFTTTRYAIGLRYTIGRKVIAE